MRRGAPRGGLRDLPGVSRGQQLGDVAGAALRDGLLFLLEDEVLVDRRFDGREHADRNREVGGEKIGEELGGVHVRLVMNPEGTLGIHDETNVNAAKLLADLFASDFPIPVGVLTAVEAPVYEDLILQQEQKAISER